MHPKHLAIADFDYDLPQEKIANFPLAKRDESKLLVYRNGKIIDDVFKNITQHLPEDSVLVVNNSKVIHARILFTKSTGSTIEIFCLEPHGDFTDYATVLQANTDTTWKCFIGAAAKWKEDFLSKSILVDGQKTILQAKKIGGLDDAYIVEFSWDNPAISFAALIEAAGNIPLPPYIKRVPIENDKASYQTIYAKKQGSVAAPTAGLHFTAEVLQQAAQKNIAQTVVTLHVGAGTFKPVKAHEMQAHIMHAEYIDVSIAAIENIKNNLGKIIAVGTTSTRTLETLYWLGVKIMQNKNIAELSLTQWEVYSDDLKNTTITAAQALTALSNWLQEHNLSTVFMPTQILIAPSYQFRVVNLLITNFHQPKSTLLLLIAAAVGSNWKNIYTYALQHQYRFLSFGDSNLYFINNSFSTQ
jgi:S-adenosylmethionine:tRNA ribosyltransferase-isomerase